MTQFLTLNGVATGNDNLLLDFHCFNTIGSGAALYYSCGANDISDKLTSTKANAFYQQNEQTGSNCQHSPDASQGFKLASLAEPEARTSSTLSYLSCYNWRNDLASRNKVRQFADGFAIKFNYGYSVVSSITAVPDTSSSKVTKGVTFTVSDAAIALVASSVALSSLSSYLF